MNISEILLDFNNNYLKQLILIEPVSDNFHKIISNPNNKKIFEEFCIKYPNFFQKINEMIYVCNRDINEIVQQKTCYCGQIKYLKNFVLGYRQFCSIKCMSKYKDTINKKRATTKLHYNVDNPAQSDIVRSKMKKTILDKYGVEHQMKSEEVKEKIRQTNLKRYGVNCPFQSDQVKEKIRKTNIEKYGFESANQHPDIKKKIQTTNEQKYGCQALSNDIIKEKIRKTNIDKYGVENYQQYHLINLDKLNEEYVRDNFIKDGYFLVEEFCSFFNCSLTYGVVKRKEFNIAEKVKTSRHKTQQKIYEWLNQYISVINKDRSVLNSGKELDIYIPEHQLAIEYDGIMFHSFGKSNHSMFNNFNDEKEHYIDHLNKTEECQKQGIQLLHIFENEWLEKQDLWKSVILNKLGLSERIFARKCIIKEIDHKTSSEFLEKNHLQGIDKSSIRIGLFHNNELVSVMTFGKSRYNKKYQYELLRFCSRQNLTVIGGASKIFKYFVNKYQPKSVISYANRRWSDGNLYRKIGFKEINKTIPNYFYFNNPLQLKSRVQFQKHKLKTMKFYDDTLTETEIMYRNGYRKIYDCGNYVFEWNINK